MAIYAPNKESLQLALALGLKIEGLKSFVLKVTGEEGVVVEASYYLTSPQLKRGIDRIETYDVELKEKEDV